MGKKISHAEILTNPQDLVELLQLERRDIEWKPRDLQEMLAHQLRLDMKEELQTADIPSPSPQWPDDIHTFEDLFAQPRPPLELLKTVCHFSTIMKNQRRMVQVVNAALPQEIYCALYCIAMAMIQAEYPEAIPAHDMPRVQECLRWLSQQEWIPEHLR